MDLRELRFALRRHWRGALVVFVVALFIGAAGAYLPEKTYRATAKIFAQPKVVDGNVADVSARATNFVIPGLLEKVQTRGFRAGVRPDLPGQYQRASVDVSATADSSVIRISVEGSRPAAVAAWANGLMLELLADETAGEFLDLSVLDDARIPQRAVSPQAVPLLFGSAVLGLIGGVFVAVLSFRLRLAFDTEEDIRELLGTRLLGEIPVTRQLRGDRTERTLIELLEEEGSDLGEAFQMLRTEIEFRLSESNPPALCVVSYQPGEGKSTVAVGLAWSLAAVGHNVTLVDADLRGPSIHRILGRPMSNGLADYEPESMTQPARTATEDRALDFVPAGLPHGRPGEVISVALPRVLEELRRDQRLAIVDSSPLNVIAEAPAVIKMAKYVVLVIDRGKWDLPELANAVARLRESGGILLGVVINKVPRRRWLRKNQYYVRPGGRRAHAPSNLEDAPSSGNGEGVKPVLQAPVWSHRRR